MSMMFVLASQSVTDTTPPSQVTGLSVGAFIGQNILNWDTATDNVFVNGYEIWSGTNASFMSLEDFSLDTSYFTSLYTQGVRQYYKVRAYDAEGNLGEFSAISSVINSTVPDDNI